MSRRTIRACDLMCDVWNETQLLEHAFPEEVERWTRRRDRNLAKLRKVVASFTPEDISFIRRKAPKLERDLAEVGAPIN
jgi:hypothetical protein